MDTVPERGWRGLSGPARGRDSPVPVGEQTRRVAEKKKPSKKNGEYGADSISILEGLEAVRKRPGMYIGSTGERGLHHLIWEVVDNSVDEAMAGHATRVDVTLLADGGVEVVDDGRGMPVSMHATGVPAVEVIMTQLHAGGKFDSDSYAVSGGLHGVGISVVNALSTKVELEIERDGSVWTQTYLYAEPEKLNKGAASSKTGTTVRFWPDGQIFETTAFSAETIARRLQEMAFLNKGLTITLTDNRISDEEAIAEADLDGDGTDKAETVKSPEEKAQAAVVRTRTYHYPDGLVDYIKHLNRTKTPIHSSVIGFSAKGVGHEVEIAMQWNSGYAESVHTFANTINTHEGGTHEEGFRAALTSTVNKYATDKKLIKEKDGKLTGDDIREGLAAVISVKVADPQFEGQTKTKLGNTEVKSFVQKACNEHLGHWFEANPAEAKTIIRKAVDSRAGAHRRAQGARAGPTQDRYRHRRPTRQARRLPQQRSDEMRGLHRRGDSAGGSAKSGRDSMYQAILPIRGKIINVEKARIDRVLKNAEVQSIITAFGTGIHDEFDLAKLRYHKIVLMADADVDGQHIATLLLTLLFRFMRPLIEHGHVYLAQPPLAKLKWQRVRSPSTPTPTATATGCSRPAAPRARRSTPTTVSSATKGLGEMNASELWETTMDPSIRVLKAGHLDDAAAADELFSILMGEDVAARRGFIARNARTCASSMSDPGIARIALSHNALVTTAGRRLYRRGTDDRHHAAPTDDGGHDRILPVDIQQEMQNSYIDYAMSVIVGRALPEVRDGLKPVHRRLLYATNDAGYRPDRPYVKSAKPVAETMGNYHPHGDTAIYDALVRLAQPWSMRYPLIDGQGNFGSRGNDGPAAMRYTEARLTPLAMEMLRDIDEETVDFVPNYDGKTEEPTVLPARIPNPLINGSGGIAVGMATNIPPHNLREVSAAVFWALENPEADDEVLLAACMDAVKGPDFPTAGLIVGGQGIRDAYTTGRGSIRMRGVVDIEENKGVTTLVITELPYQVNPDNLIQSIAEQVNEGKLKGISRIEDQSSDRVGMRIVVTLRRDGVAKVVLNNLYKHSQLQTSFGANMLSIVDGVPRTLRLDQMIRFYVAHQIDVIVRRTRYRLRKAEERAHILRGWSRRSTH